MLQPMLRMMLSFLSQCSVKAVGNVFCVEAMGNVVARVETDAEAIVKADAFFSIKAVANAKVSVKVEALFLSQYSIPPLVASSNN